MGLRGRPPKPTKLKILTGSHNLPDDAADEPQPLAGAPACPKWITGEARKLWKHIVHVMGATGVLTQAELSKMEALCRAYARWRKAEEEIDASSEVIKDPDGKLIENPWLHVASAWLDKFDRLGSALGLDPVMRTRLRVGGTRRKGVAQRDRTKGPPPPPPSPGTAG